MVSLTDSRNPRTQDRIYRKPMRRTGSLVALFIAVVLGFFAVRRSGSVDDAVRGGVHPTDSVDGTAYQQPIHEPDLPALAEDDVPTGRTVVPPAETPAMGIVVIQVTRAGGEPGSGFPVRVRTRDESRLIEGTTDELGRAAFEVPAGLDLRYAHVGSTPTTVPAREWLDRTVRGGEVLSVPIQVAEGWTLVGRVVGPDGQPVPRAEVLGWSSRKCDGEPDRVVSADQAGEFQIFHLGPTFCVTARAPGLGCSMGLTGQLSESVTAPGLTVELVPERRLVGIVLDPSQAPVPGAELWIECQAFASNSRVRTTVDGVFGFFAGHGRVVSDGEGEYEFTGLTRPEYIVRAKQAPYLIARVACTSDGALNRIVLDGGVTLRGRVTDAAGRPAVGARVRYWPFSRDVQTVDDEVLCDENGEFLLTGMTRENNILPYSIRVRHEGHALQIVQPVRPSDTGGGVRQRAAGGRTSPGGRGC